MARCLYYGIGTKRDLAKAFAWYLKAAQHGDLEAQYEVGKAYELGDGVTRDLRMALRWYKKAAAQGDDAAHKAVMDLTRR